MQYYNSLDQYPGVSEAKNIALNYGWQIDAFFYQTMLNPLQMQEIHLNFTKVLNMDRLVTYQL